MQILRSFWKDKRGATAIEYGLIAALIAVTLIAGFGALANNLSNTFNYIAGKVNV